MNKIKEIYESAERINKETNIYAITFQRKLLLYNCRQYLYEYKLDKKTNLYLPLFFNEQD